MVKRVLVTSALEETWPEGEPVLFLGEWCRPYDRKDRWQHMDAKVLPYHWDDRPKLQRDYAYLRGLYEELLVRLASELNRAHGEFHSLRYWRIVAGLWLGYFIQILFDRWTGLRQAIDSGDVERARIVAGGTEWATPKDMAEFQSLMISDAWNEAICAELLACLGFPIEAVSRRDSVAGVSVREMATAEPGGRLGKLRAGIAGIVNAFRSDRDYFFITTYLPPKQNLLLQLRLGQVPKAWRAPAMPDLHVRQHEWRCADQDPRRDTADFRDLAWPMVRRHMPRAYLEGYRNLVEMVQSLPWPRHPKAIFTSNSWSSDDAFKVWAAGKMEEGVPLVIGQHGGNYGMARWSFTEEHQIAVADRFLTWGWSVDGEETAKVVPCGYFKGLGIKAAARKAGGALLIELGMPATSYHMYAVPVARQWLDYFEDQCQFVEALPAQLREQLLVRLSARDYGWCQKARWLDRHPTIRLDEGLRPMIDLISQSRLSISTYNATSFLETLSLNVPTIMFWNPAHWELRDSAVPYFDALKSVGIFHETPESAAEQMARVWDDVDAWWQSDNVQDVRRDFCRNYACLPTRLSARLEAILRSVADQRPLPS